MLLFSALVRQHQRRFLKAAHKEIYNTSDTLPAKKSEDEVVKDVKDVSSNTSGRCLQFTVLSFELVNASSYILYACILPFM